MPSFEVVKSTNGSLVGLTQEDQEKWTRYVRYQENLEPGEFFRLSYKTPRNPQFHRKFMKMVRFAFEQWEPEKARKRMTYKGHPISKTFDTFRDEMLILAGYCTAQFDARGRVNLVADSISFDNMTEDTFRELYPAVYEVLFKRIFESKGYSREELDRVLAEFERFQPT